MMNKLSCRISTASRLDNALSKNRLYNHAFLYAATTPLRTISFLSPVVCSTGYNGESGWYVTHQCLNSVPFHLGSLAGIMKHLSRARRVFFMFGCMRRLKSIPFRHPDRYSRNTSEKCFTTAPQQTFRI